MPELRWTLLIIGVVFIVALAWWERRRPHQAARQTMRDAGETRVPGLKDTGWGAADVDTASPRVHREPTLTLPEIRPREPVAAAELPVIEIADDSLIGLRVDGEPVEEQVAAAEAANVIEPVEDVVPPVEPPPRVEEPAPEPLPELPETAPDPIEPIVDWPPEEERKLLALRLVAPQQGRFSGRAVRQALAAEGFVLGKFSIFHKPDAENRARVSVASLTKPGTFDFDTMDTQRFTGLNIFAVLPGPRPPLKVFEELLGTARTLNERLEGALQDDRGGPLTPMRIASIREELA